MANGWGAGEWGASRWGAGTSDFTPPVILNAYPEEFGVVGANTNVQFDVVDLGSDPSGILRSSIHVWIAGVLAYDGTVDTFDPDFSGPGTSRTEIANGLHFSLDRVSLYVDGYNTVTVHVSDKEGNVCDYSWAFIVRTHLPTSDEFNSMDVQGPDMDGLLTYPEVTGSGGEPVFHYDHVAKTLDVNSDSGISSTILFDLATGTKFTAEFDFCPVHLPYNLSQLQLEHFFVGAYDQQGKGGGILISKAGIALANEIGESIAVIPGSQALIEEGIAYYTIRFTIDAEAAEMNVFITKTADIALHGHVLRYTSGTADSPIGVSDGLYVDILGQSSHPLLIKFHTLRYDGYRALIPNKRPIAAPGADRAATVGSTIRYNATNSYDPEGSPLTYFWSLIDAPEGSRFRISGTDGETSDNGDADGFTNVFSVAGSGSPFSVDNSPLLQPGDTLFVGGSLYTVAVGEDGQTPWWLLVEGTGAFERNITIWDNQKLLVTEESIPDSISGANWSVLHSNTFFDDQTRAETYSIPDIQGLYDVRLIVNDGQLDSLPSTSLLSVASTSVVLGTVPTVDFIWRHLSDFWNMLEDKAVITTAWSGFAQAIAAQLLSAWQIDYSKSLLDIQRVFQRRWLSYSTLVSDNPDTANIKIVRGAIVGDVSWSGGKDLAAKSLEVILDNGRVESVVFVGVPGTPMSLDVVVAQINEQLGFTSIRNPLAQKVASSFIADTYYLALTYPTLLRIRPNGTANALLGLSTTTYVQNDLSGAVGTVVVDHDTVFKATVPPTINFQAEGVAEGDVLVFNNEMRIVQRISQLVPLSGLSSYSVLHLQEAVTSFGSYAWQLPSVVTSMVTDFSAVHIQIGDLARFDVRDLTTGTIQEVACEIVGVLGKRLGFNPAPLLIKYNGNVANYVTEFVGVRRTQMIPVADVVKEIPRLQEYINSSPTFLSQNKDFLLKSVDGTRAIVFIPGTFSLMVPPPDTFWAEATYLDNRPAIEANFGSLVNFTVEELTTYTDDLDYLSAVRGLWYAYWGGPSIQKIRIGTQILLGLPFAEETGVIETIDPTFSLLEGRILIRDKSNAAIVRSYFYPKVAGLALNDATGNVIAVGDTISRFASLSGGIEILDSVNSPEWMRPYASFVSEASKAFRFLIRGDVDTFNTINMKFAVDFVNKIKPHYTYPVFSYLKNAEVSEISTVDSVTISLDKLIMTAPKDGGPGAFRWDDNVGGVPFAPPNDSLKGDGVTARFYDESPDSFLFDQPLDYPEMSVSAHVRSPLDASPWAFDSIWAFDNGNNDEIPLSGPDSQSPAPYGPEVGIVSYDGDKPAGTYTRRYYL